MRAHPSYFDSILAARGDNRVLLSDDRPSRALATEATGVKGVWSQAAVMSALVSQKITLDDYCKVAVTLAEAGYFYTSVNCGTFIYALRQSNWAITPTIQALIALLARPQNDPVGVLAVLAELMRVGWAQKPDDRDYEDLFAELFLGFRKAQPRCDLVALAQMTFSNVAGVLLRQLFDARFADELRNSTQLTPIAVVAAEINELRHRVGSRITGSLNNALRRASNWQPEPLQLPIGHPKS